MTSEVVTLSVGSGGGAGSVYAHLVPPPPPKPILYHVPTAEFKQHWPRVKAGLERILADEKLVCDWIAEDVYADLRDGQAFLSLIGDDGFLVWQRYAGTDRRGMLFILACEGSGMLKHYPAIYAELEAMARAVNTKRIRHISMRKEWESKFWKLTGYVYEHEVA